MTQASTSSNLAPPCEKAGWSLLELIGIMAVAAILAAALIPVLVRQYDRDARNLERQNLSEIADAFQFYAFRFKAIPDQTTFFDKVGIFWGRPKWMVQTNDRGNARYVLIDSRIRLGTDFTVTSPLPYVQNYKGSTNKPINPRMMLVTSLGLPLPAGAQIVSGYCNTNIFDSLWTAQDDCLPTGAVWTAWAGVASDLLIQRIDMTSWFEPIRLTTTTTFGCGRFKVDDSPGASTFMEATNRSNMANVSYVMPRPFVQNYYLHGSTLYFVNANYGGSTVKTQAIEIVQAPCRYIYENSLWKVDFGGGTTPNRGLIGPDDMAYALSKFTDCATLDGATNGPNLVYIAMSNYMKTYMNWSSNLATWNDADGAATDLKKALKNCIKDNNSGKN